MPIFSYLVYPHQGLKENLIKDLAAIEHCEVIPSTNEEVLILLTDTQNENAEKELIQKLKSLKSLQSLSMTFGHADE